jgi:hypothetical protein
MNKLWIFGDSFSATNKRKNIERWRRDYIKWKGYTTNVWPEYINDKLNFKLINLSISATDNYTIFDTIIDNIDKIEQNDIVIIGWTSTLRFRLIDKTNSFNTIRPSSNLQKSTLEIPFEYNNISLNTINEILINRDTELYEWELNRFIKIINLYLKNVKILHWSPFQLQHPHLKIKRISDIDGLETISMETGGELNDYHYSESAHSILSEKIYTLLYE